MSQVWSQPVVADNRAGANGVVAAKSSPESPADGYTVDGGDGSRHQSADLQGCPDGDKDFVSISLVATFPQLVLVHPAVGHNHRRADRAVPVGHRQADNLCLGRQRLVRHLAGAVRPHGDVDDPRRLTRAAIPPSST